MTDWKIGDLAVFLGTGNPNPRPQDRAKGLKKGGIYRVERINRLLSKTMLFFEGVQHIQGANSRHCRKIPPDKAEGHIEDWNMLLDSVTKKDKVDA